MANVTLFNLIIYSTDHSQMSSLASLSIEILVMLTSKFKHTLLISDKIHLKKIKECNPS